MGSWLLTSIVRRRLASSDACDGLIQACALYMHMLKASKIRARIGAKYETSVRNQPFRPETQDVAAPRLETTARLQLDSGLKA